MKKSYVYLLIIFIAIFAFIGCEGSFGLNSGNAHALASVNNWENYKSFGVGTTNSGSRVISSENGYELVGVRKDGSIEALTYDDKTGKKVSATLYVGAFVDYNRFALVVLSLRPYGYVETNEDLNTIVALGGDYYYGDSYLIDKQTGKLYLLDEKVGTFQINDGCAWEAGGIFYAMEYGGSGGLKIFRIDNNLQLTVETFMGEEYRNVRTDRYENMFYTTNGVTYVLSLEGRLNVVPSERGKNLYQGFNGIIYYGQNHCYDASGNLVETSFAPQQLYMSEYLRHKIPLVNTDIDYIYWHSNEIYWVHFLDSDKIQYEVKKFPSSTKENITICGGYLVWLSDAQIKVLDLLTGATGKISLVNGSDSVYVDKLSRGGDGLVYFSGLDQNRNTIEGVLNTDLTYSFEATPYSKNRSSIVYISPIN